MRPLLLGSARCGCPLHVLLTIPTSSRQDTSKFDEDSGDSEEEEEEDAKLDGEEYGGDGGSSEALLARVPTCQGSLHNVMACDAGKWDNRGMSVVITAPVASASRFMAASSVK